ncbi:MAG TPA: guanylate kinase, partial [Bacteroidales bacterium]|nr:guanylate kinase [Bacteroidales bacterium]
MQHLETGIGSGRLVIVSAPSGAGKSTMVRALLNAGLGLNFSVSACNRPPRGREVHGREYFFFSTEEFLRMIGEGAFLEWEEVYPGRYYGTLRSEVERLLASGKHVIFDVDVMGGLNIKRQYGARALALFIMPPS